MEIINHWYELGVYFHIQDNLQEKVVFSSSVFFSSGLHNWSNAKDKPQINLGRETEEVMQ